MILSFCGSSFLGIYHLGVVEACAKHGQKLLSKVVGYSGASSGALVAAWLSFYKIDHSNLQVCKDLCYDIAEKSRSKKFGMLTPGYSLLQDVEEMLREVIPHNAYQEANGKLYISLTQVKGWKNCMISQFTSNDHLIQCLLASAYIPYITAKKPVFINQQRYVDGGLSNNLPRVDKDCVTVSPFSGRQDICPQDKSLSNLHLALVKQEFKVNSKNLLRGHHGIFPPDKAGMNKYFNQGFHDAVRYLKQEGLYT